MDRSSRKAWLYLLPAAALLAVFLVYPVIDVLIYSFEEGFNFASQSYWGTGWYNYSYVLHDPYFLQAVQNTFVLVIITVPVSTGLALAISAALASIRPLRNLYQTIYFLPYVTNTLAVGLVFMVLFQKTEYTDGLVNLMLRWFGAGPIDFINGPHWAKMFVLCFYTIWVVLPSPGTPAEPPMDRSMTFWRAAPVVESRTFTGRMARSVLVSSSLSW